MSRNSSKRKPSNNHNNNEQTMLDTFCNNCGRKGHLFYQCKMPITSNGIIVFRTVNDKSGTSNFEYLMIRRRDTLGYLDFMRGKYSLYQKSYILNMMNQMTVQEKQLLRNKYYLIRTDERVYSKDKLNMLILGIEHDGEYYDLLTLLNESDTIEQWTDPEWGFPKGRRNLNESDYNCAIREFTEETGYAKEHLHDLSNMVPVQEVFTGSNYYSYKHKYYIMYMEPENAFATTSFQKSEVSSIEWKNIEECLQSIRPYNLEKRAMIQKIDTCLKNNKIIKICQS
jgi:8-oxo-dGTP pyrophosphatase MutT (NUDIX family)|tara:strand:+ start:2139 stop:2987 length:849 start_codon:yes stop_codon:yes gene_type:complete